MKNQSNQNLIGVANDGLGDYYKVLVQMAEIDIKLSVVSTEAGVIAKLGLSEMGKWDQLTATVLPSAQSNFSLDVQ